MVNKILEREAKQLRGIAQRRKPAKTGSKERQQKHRGSVSRGNALITDSQEPTSIAEPPYRYDVHLKHKELTVVVMLHKIPPQYIDLNQSTHKMLVVDTSGYTKKLRLEFPFPPGIQQDPEKGDYTLDAGVLTCKFKLDTVPKDMARDIEAKIQENKESKGLRFRYNSEGELVMRSRKSSLRKSDTLEAPQKQKAKTEEEVVEQVEMPPAKRKRLEKQAGIQDKTAESSEATNVKKSKPAKALMSDDNMMAIAKSTAKNAKETLKEKILKAKMLQQQRNQKQVSNEASKEQKMQQLQVAYQRLLDEKKSKLEKEKQLRQPRPRKQTSKSVKFSE